MLRGRLLVILAVHLASATHLDDILVGCSEICNTTITGVKSHYFPFIEKKVDCAGLWSNRAIDASRPSNLVHSSIPTALISHFTYDGRVRIIPYEHGILNQVYLGGNAFTPVWKKDAIDADILACASNTLEGTYGLEVTSMLFKGLKRIHSEIVGSRVLVIGSERPWVESCVLAAGAASVVTLEYGSIKSEHPQITTITPDEMRKKFADGTLGSFDVIATFSSVEHSGLGRYGDALNPYGDLQSIARAWCVAKPGAPMLIGVPYLLGPSGDTIEYNAHRVYGPLMYSHLVANWEQVDLLGLGQLQPLLTVRKKVSQKSGSCN